MAKVFLDSHDSNLYSVIAARLTTRCGRPVKYSETIRILSGIDDDMLSALIDRYNAANPDQESQTA